MKSFLKFATLAMAFAVAACTGVEEWDNTPYTPEPVIPEPEEPGLIEFTANVATKTSLDEATGTVTWVAGDEVLFVWEGGSVTAAATISGLETKFKVKVADGIDKLYAVYPATLKASVTNGLLTLESEEATATLKEYLPVLNKEQDIPKNLARAIEELQPYLEYLD